MEVKEENKIEFVNAKTFGHQFDQVILSAQHCSHTQRM